MDITEHEDREEVAGPGTRVLAVECAAGRVLASGFPQGHVRNRRGAAP